MKLFIITYRRNNVTERIELHGKSFNEVEVYFENMFTDATILNVQLKKGEYMKNIIIMTLLALILGACAKNGEMGPQGLTGIPAPIPSVTDFQGFYVLPDSGYLEVVKDSGSLNDLTQLRLVVRNSDGSMGLLPLTQVLNIPTTNDKIYYYANLNYVALTNNIKTDVGNTALVGSFWTMLTVSHSNGLSIRVQISNGSSVVFDHTVTETH